MIETILNYLNARLATLGRIDTTYCLTERRKREGEAVATIPYAYTGGGEFRPVDVDNGSSAWWRARTGWSKEPVTVVGRAVKQQRGTYPLRLFVLLRRKDSVSDDAMMPARLADDLSELLNFENGDLQLMLNADTVSVRASNADPDTTRTYQEEFSTPVADLHYTLCMVAMDVTVDVTGDYKCWQGECDTDPDILRLFNFCAGSVTARLTPEQVECLDSDVVVNGEDVGTTTLGQPFPLTVVQNGLPVGTWNGTEWVVPPCEDATFTLEDTNGNTLDSGSIPSGGSDVIVAPDASWALEDTAGGPLGSGSILSGGSDTIVAPDAAWTLQNTAGGTLSSGSIVSNGSDVIVAPNASVGINGNAGLFTVPSGSPINIGVEDSDGNPTGAFDPNTNSWVIPPCPPSGGSISVSVSDANPDVGDTITITATPTGFTPTLYKFFVYNGMTITMLSEQPSPVFAWTVNVTTGSWTVYVMAADGTIQLYGKVGITVNSVYYLDLWGADARSAVSMQRLSSTYAGSMLRARVISTEQNIGFVGDARDNAALSAFAGSSSAFMPRWDDQSGITGGNMVMTTAGNQPRVALNGVPEQSSGIDSLFGDGSTMFFQCAEMNTLLRAADQPFTHHFVFQFNLAASNIDHAAWGMGNRGTSISRHALVFNPVTGSGSYFRQYSTAAGQNLVANFTLTDPYDMHLVTVDNDGTVGRVWLDGVLVATSNAVSGSFSQTMELLAVLAVQTAFRNFYFHGHVFESIFHSASQFDAGNITAQMANIMARHGL